MVRALHDNDVGLLGRGAGQLDSRFNGLGSRIPEENGVERRVWEDRDQLFEKGDLRGAEANVDLGVGNLAALRGGGGADFGMAVTEIHDADASCEIEQLDALVRSYECALALFEDMFGQAANALCNVLLAESCGVHFRERFVCGRKGS